MKKEIEVFRYRGYTIRYDPKPIPLRTSDWDWVHDDYDGPPDERCGASASLKEAKRDIDEIEDSSNA